jgi:hypothetical protein
LASVTKVNEKFIAQQQGKVTVNDLVAIATLEQLAMQYEILIVLGTMLFEPETPDETLPELPKKIIGFH